MSFRVLLDTNVLIPIIVADVFLRCAERGFYDLLWPDRIIEEVSRMLVQLNPSIPRNNIDERIQDMIRAFSQTTVSDWKVFRERCPELPDSNDEHVCAVAIAGNADVIVTSNPKDFPQDTLKQVELFAQGPDGFMLDLWNPKSWYPQRIVTITDEMSDVRGFSWKDMVHRLSKVGLPKFISPITEWYYDNNADQLRLLRPVRSVTERLHVTQPHPESRSVATPVRVPLKSLRRGTPRRTNRSPCSSRT